MAEEPQTYTAFTGDRMVASGPLAAVLPEVKRRSGRRAAELVLIFDDRTGRQVDFDLRGTIEEALARAVPGHSHSGPGRPRLGVVSREVSLLPRHWEWLEKQPNGASAALRRLVDEARHREPERQRARLAMDAADRFMSAMAGNLPGYEEASRALYSGRRARFEQLIRDWPRDLRAHAARLSQGAFVVAGGEG